MTHNDDFIERLENYLDEYEGITPLPDAVRDAIRAELPRTKQIGPGGGPSRFLSMTLSLSPTARYGLAAAIVLAAALIGANFLGRDGSIGGPSASPTPTASPSPTSVPTSAQPWDLLDAASGADLAPGEYYLDLPAYPARIGFEVPEGWWHYWPTAAKQDADVHAILVNSMDTVGVRDSSGWGLAFSTVGRVRVDPCDSAAGFMASSVSESARALARAFETWSDFQATVQNVTLGGYSGKRVEITRAEGVTCPAGLFTTPAGYMYDLQPPSSLAVPDRFTFLDVEGSVLVVWTTDFPATTPFEVDSGASPDPQAHAADQEQLHDILDSIVIEPR